MINFQKPLQSLKDAGRFRSLILPMGIDLTSNDYLGMADHPQLKKFAINALEEGLNIGAAGSRLLRGHTNAHKSLEDFSAQHFQSGKTLYFSSGFQANYAMFTTLPARKGIILYDSLIHASVRDGLSASKAKSFKFSHNDLNALEDLLKLHSDNVQTIWIAVESIYSMDGDYAPLSEIYDLCKKFDAYLIIDEAHATGIFGDNGKGLAWDLIQKYGYDRIITLHTCGKAIGVAGGLICASKDIIDYMINTARPFIYSTAPMPLQALLVQKSLEILSSPDGEERRKKLLLVCKEAKELLGGNGTHILPIILGEDKEAIRISTELQNQGFDIRAIRPPTVPKGSSRLRLSLSSSLNMEVLRNFASCFNIVKNN